MPMLTKQSPDELVGFMTMLEYTNGYEHTSDQEVVNDAVQHKYTDRVDRWNARKGHNCLFIGEWSFATASNKCTATIAPCSTRLFKSSSRCTKKKKGVEHYGKWKATGTRIPM
ncbi:hypothetical protein PsorP6_011415 [Peronosclerospora sorghi]|uniref:Uncharacterized protein n=1 Tax=Peronosclerospora sorghi TaxID=230839 RepID=A0ACC0WME3_9STRA|nr:hypothetical protein PsorP6_011415 [Peronosclerospora sorghi]